MWRARLIAAMGALGVIVPLILLSGQAKAASFSSGQQSVAGRRLSELFAPLRLVAAPRKMADPYPAALDIEFINPAVGDHIPQGIAPFVVEAQGIGGYNYTIGRLAPNCMQMHFDWGDGTIGSYPCKQEGKAIPMARHTYERPGLFYVRAWPTFGDYQSTTPSMRPEELPYTRAVVVEAAPQPLSIGQIARPVLWIAALGGAVGLWVMLGRWMEGRPWRRKLGRSLIVMALLAWVPPFSYAPTPLAFLAGGYDPRLPFVNRFLLAGDATEVLGKRLEGLLGQTGLDPFDPVHPLAGYEFKWVSLRGRDVVVTTEMIYTDGSRRTYEIPVEPDYGIGFYLTFGPRYNWNDLNRLYAEHVEFSIIQFANRQSPIRLEIPEEIPLSDEVSALFKETGTGEWIRLNSQYDYLEPRILPSPDGRLLLVRQDSGWARDNKLWKLDLKGDASPVLMTDNAHDFTWSPDGKYIIYNRDWDPTTGQVANVMKADTPGMNTTGETFTAYLPGFTRDGLWIKNGEELIIYPFEIERDVIKDFDKVNSFLPVDSNNIYPNPDGSRILYSCQAWKLCYQAQSELTEWPTELYGPGSSYDRYQIRVAWNQDGERAAVAVTAPVGEYGYRNSPVRLYILGEHGATLHQVEIAPNGEAGTPQWTPDGRFVLLQTTPYGGRRIVAVDTETGEAWDLSQPHWDAWFTLMPDGKSVLLTNGRGGLWRANVIYNK